jgi:hypothetical protein
VIDRQARWVSRVKACRAAASASKVPGSGDVLVALIMRAISRSSEDVLQCCAVVGVGSEIEP